MKFPAKLSDDLSPRLRFLIWHLLFAAALYAMGHADFVRYLLQAQTCLDEAERATREVDKEAWLKLGEEWMEMARKAQGLRPYEH
ncbi:hypothetical protein JEY40_37730 [Bradyrhizobium japonicum]|uniref:Uncharacterized protein n=1 Tax=Bradyrhizobium japonicum TaxID=375 RepID=A0A0A3Y6K5_BRAJP|nr:hypothetical protein [Bradyrhizobium japonicum]KGT81194.1 hypothetical protein MA20_00040 [Bradyrhizobium japonicum]MCW2220260.1 hypothetical protein [Bradyrhizobium japonicum]MCW2344874.1 hypothetical protein [Bradyrhizobium japonicum]UQD71528.1 hypothetical protein JEY40_37730 [Bradyrhizobium japonicum]